ncbi:MAG: hypothetical protein ACRYFX_21055 [Janthinobacterium lividum]
MNSLPRPHETLHFQNAIGKLFYQPAGYVRLAWGPDRVTLDVVQAYYEQALALLRRTDVRRILSDHGQRAPLAAATQEWLTTNWIPRAMRETHTQHCAIVEGADPMHRLSTQSVISLAPKEFVFKRFDTVEQAEEWLFAH